ncbi:MAG: interleukin-like EMT inducer domain-containing protein [Anaerolineae bacterium]
MEYLGQNPLYSTHTFYPLGIDLVLYTYNLFNALVSLPLQPFLSLPVISNLTFLFATTLSGYGAFLLVEYIVRDMRNPIPPIPNRRGVQHGLSDLGYWAAFLAGLIYAFGSYRLVYAAIGHYNLWSTEWIPFFALFLIKTIRESRWRNAIFAGLFLTLALLCDMMHGVFVGILALVTLAFAVTRPRRTRIPGGLPALFKRLVVMGLVATILYSPMLAPILREMFGGYELTGWGDVEKLSVDLAGLVTPTALHPLGGDWTDTLRQTREGTSRFRDVNTVFLGWTGLALAVVGAVRYRRRLAAWITSAVLFAVLSLGPLLQINGRSTFDLDGLKTTVPLPFILLHYIPVIKANRVPNRFSVVLMLALAVLAGFGAYWLLKQAARLKPETARIGLVPCCLLLSALLLFEHWSVPLPLTDARIPPVYEQVAAEPGDFAILQLPLGWRNSFGVQGAESTQTQYYQTYHHKRLLSGNISRNPPFKFNYFRRVPILDSLITLETYGQVDAERRAADQATAADFVRFYHIRYVVVAPGVPGRPPYVDTRDEAVAYVEQVLPVEKVYDQGGWLLYRVNPLPTPTTLTLDFGSLDPAATMALGEGWAKAEEIQGSSANWAVDQGARVFLPATGETDYRLAVTALPFDYPGAEEQAVRPEVNGHLLDEPLTLSPGWGSYEWTVPARFLHPGLNELRLEFARLDAPADVLPGDGVIGGTGIRAPAPIEVNSGGPADFAYITIGDANADETEDGSVHRPGYNIAIIDPKTGKLLDRRGFDTTVGGNELEAAALANYVEKVPEGQIVLAAMQGDGTAHLTDAAIAAFRAVGGQADLKGTTGWSHAIVGVKGGAPGTALEAAGPDNGWLRVAPDRRTLAIAVDAITWQPSGE